MLAAYITKQKTISKSLKCLFKKSVNDFPDKRAKRKFIFFSERSTKI